MRLLLLVLLGMCHLHLISGVLLARLRPQWQMQQPSHLRIHHPWHRPPTTASARTRTRPGFRRKLSNLKVLGSNETAALLSHHTLPPRLSPLSTGTLARRAPSNQNLSLLGMLPSEYNTARHSHVSSSTLNIRLVVAVTPCCARPIVARIS